MHTLADIYQKIVSRKWTGRIGMSKPVECLNTTLSADQFAQDIVNAKNRFEEQINHGDVVIVRVDAHINSVASIFSLWHLGAVVVPVKFNIETQAITDIASDCNARFMISTETLGVTPLNSYRFTLNKFELRSRARVSGSDKALIIYTSGSTGKPKGIILTHSNVIAALRAISDYLNIGTGDIILNVSPLSFDYGLYQVLFAIQCDCSVILYNESVNPITLVKAIERHQVTLFPVLPVLATLLEKGAQLLKTQLPSLRKLTNTGGHLSESTIDSLQSQFPQLSIYAMYGLTESKRALYLPPEDLKRKPGSVGIPMPGLEAKVFRTLQCESGNTRYIEVDPGEVGTLFVRGSSVMQGYTRADANAGARLIEGNYREDNWLETGDLFAQDEDGYFYFKGRSKELIKQGGYCLYANDIEESVLANKAIQFASVVGTKDKFETEIACLFIKLHEDLSTEEHQTDITNWIKQTLGQDYCPRLIKFVDDVKLSINGKIDKKQMLAAYA